MIVNLHIESLVLDGLTVGSHQGPLVQAAVEAELSRLIGEDDFATQFPRDRAEPLIRAAPIAGPAAEGAGLGRQIGRAIYGGIAG